MNAYQKRVVLCCGVYCNLGDRADALHEQLQATATALNDAHDAAGKWNEPRPLGVKVATCLDMCGAGPNAVPHPGHHIANHLDAATLHQFIQAHLNEHEHNKMENTTDHD